MNKPTTDLDNHNPFDSFDSDSFKTPNRPIVPKNRLIKVEGKSSNKNKDESSNENLDQNENSDESLDQNESTDESLDQDDPAFVTTMTPNTPLVVPDDVYEYFRKLERAARIIQLPKNYVCRQRAIVVDYLVKVHDRFCLQPETLFLAVALLDRYVAAVPTTRGKVLQLVAVAAIWIASKYEDIWPPSMSDLLDLIENICTWTELKSMERTLLVAVRYDIGSPLPLHFLRNILVPNHSVTNHAVLKILNYGVTYHTGLYILMLSLLHVTSFLPSELAAAAADLAWEITKESPGSTRFTVDQLAPCRAHLQMVLRQSVCSSLQAVRGVGSARKNLRVAQTPEMLAYLATLFHESL